MSIRIWNWIGSGTILTIMFLPTNVLICRIWCIKFFSQAWVGVSMKTERPGPLKKVETVTSRNIVTKIIGWVLWECRVSNYLDFERRDQENILQMFTMIMKKLGKFHLRWKK